MTDKLTPVERHGSYWLKRDDLYEIAGVKGGKARTCWHLAQGATGLTTAGARQSPQINIVASVANHLGIPCRVHTASGDLTPELRLARDKGAEIVQHKPGYNSVIIYHAREEALAMRWTYIPFGMECWEAVEQTRAQIANVPPQAKHIVMPAGSGMSLAGVLHGLQDRQLHIPVLGVCVGADPIKRLDKYAPLFWQLGATLVKSPLPYHQEASETCLEDIALDPIYEAKCIHFLQPDDLLWVVGIRESCDVPVPTGTFMFAYHIPPPSHSVEEWH